jgi:hypothetical protein
MCLGKDQHTFVVHKLYYVNTLDLARTQVYNRYKDLHGILQCMCKHHLGRWHLIHKEMGYKDLLLQVPLK